MKSFLVGITSRIAFTSMCLPLTITGGHLMMAVLFDSMTYNSKVKIKDSLSKQRTKGGIATKKRCRLITI